MTGVLITSLPNASTLTGAEYVPVVQSGTTVKTTIANMGPVGTFIQSGTNAVVTTVQSKLRETISVLDFMTDAQRSNVINNVGSIDVTAAIQAAIDSVCPLYGTGDVAGSIYFPSGKYLVTQTIDLTNTRTAGTLVRDGIKIFGDGPSSQIVGQTGDGYAIIETSGSQWLTLSHLNLTVSTTNPSSVGIYQGLNSVLTQTQNQKYEQIVIGMSDNIALNSGNGSIAIWNFGAEENTYDTCFFQANIACLFTTQVNSPATYPHPKHTQESSHSLGMTTFSGECFAVSLGRRRPPIILLGVNSFDFENTYISNVGSGGANNYAMAFYSQNAGINYNGTIEQLGTLYVNYQISASRFKIVFGGIIDSSAPIIYLQRGAAGIINNSEFLINNNDPSAQTRNLFSVVPTGANENVSCYLQSSTFRTNLPVGYTGLNENLIWNPSTTDVMIYGTGWRYEISVRKHRIYIEDLTIGTTGTATEICKVLMPTIISATSAGGLGLKIEGMVGTTSYGDNARSTVYLTSTGCVSTNQNGVMTFGTPSTAVTGTANVSGAGNNITGVTVTLSAAAVATNVSVKLTPTITGVNGSSSTFSGYIDMYWSGWSSCGPTLLQSGQTTP